MQHDCENLESYEVRIVPETWNVRNSLRKSPGHEIIHVTLITNVFNFV
jgi:hypothetical protein